MKKILFMIPSLGHGGAEKVLVNLVNNMDREQFDITVLALFDGGVNRQFLAPHIHYKSVFKKVFPANCKILSLFSPAFLYRSFVKEKYDIEVSYLEGVCARILAGGEIYRKKKNIKNVKSVSWIHVELHTPENASYPFRSYQEAKKLYGLFDKTVCVSKTVHDDFQGIYNLEKSPIVLYNTVESDIILEKSKEEVTNGLFLNDEIKLVNVASLKASKGYDRLLNIHHRLKDNGFPVHTYILGEGDDKEKLVNMAKELGIYDKVSFLGYDTNPYKYVAKCDLFVCPSHAEGFSTSVTESLIVGTPVCTTLVSGMVELLGENNEYGIITENSEDALYDGVYKMLTTEGLLEEYKQKAFERGKLFSTKNTVLAVEKMMLEL